MQIHTPDLMKSGVQLKNNNIEGMVSRKADIQSSTVYKQFSSKSSLMVRNRRAGQKTFVYSRDAPDNWLYTRTFLKSAIWSDI
jgi:hypothetical protein